MTYEQALEQARRHGAADALEEFAGKLGTAGGLVETEPLRSIQLALLGNIAQWVHTVADQIRNDPNEAEGWVREYVAGLVPPRVQEHWDWTQKRRAASGSGSEDCVCTTCELMQALIEHGSACHDGEIRHLTIPRPHVPHGPEDVTPEAADAEYMRWAVRDIRHAQDNGRSLWGSPLTGTICKLLGDVAEALDSAAGKVE